MGVTRGVVGSAETGSPSRGTLASLREASTSPLTACISLLMMGVVNRNFAIIINYKTVLVSSI